MEVHGYNKSLRNRDGGAVTGRPRTDESGRFWRFVAKAAGSSCWLWSGGTDKDGYGLFQISQPRRTVRAHRFSYCEANNLNIRSLPRSTIIRHTCDNPKCARPDHLEAGTTQDNVEDKMQRGRFKKTRPNAVLAPTDIPAIRARLLAGERHGKIAHDYGVVRATISQIARGQNWKEV